MSRRSSMGTGTAFAAILLCAGFAAWPVAPNQVALVPAKETAPAAVVEVAALNVAAFRMPIWVADPAPTPPQPLAAAPPPPPLRIQLLAIIHEGEVYKAAVYDQDADKILVVAAGEKIGTRSVDKVNSTALTLRDGSQTRIISLKTGEGS